MDRFAELREKVVPLLSPYAKKIAVFGSFARGDDTPESDIDILVDFSEPIGWEVVDLKEHLEDLLSHKVDLILKGVSPIVPGCSRP